MSFFQRSKQFFLVVSMTLLSAGNTLATPTTPSIADLTEAREFAQDLAQRHGFDAEQLLGQFSKIRSNPRVLQLIAPPTSPTQRSWERYRPRFVNPQRIAQGVEFWQENALSLARARALYGVPEEIIVAIIGIETVYGRNTGSFSVLEALATLAFEYPRRAEFFRIELEQFLLLTRENQQDPLSVRGSYAGAIGIPQFMPGSQRRYAIDFDGDQRIDLGNSVADSIGSVARFLEQHGWQSGQEIAVPARLPGKPEIQWLEAGIQPRLRAGDLLAQGVQANVAPESVITLVDLISPGKATEYWLGHNNFYVITRYNRSSFYAMSVFHLAEEIRRSRGLSGR